MPITDPPLDRSLRERGRRSRRRPPGSPVISQRACLAWRFRRSPARDGARVRQPLKEWSGPARDGGRKGLPHKGLTAFRFRFVLV